MGSSLSPIALMIVLAVIFVSAGHFLLFCLLLLLADLVHIRRFRLLLVLTRILILFCHVILLIKAISSSAEKLHVLR